MYRNKFGLRARIQVKQTRTRFRLDPEKVTVVPLDRAQFISHMI